MRKQFWLILLGAGLAVAVMMKLKKQSMQAARQSGKVESGYEGAAVIRDKPTANSEGFEGAAVIRKSKDSMADDGFEGAAVIRGSADETIVDQGITGGASIRSQDP